MTSIRRVRSGRSTGLSTTSTPTRTGWAASQVHRRSGSLRQALETLGELTGVLGIALEETSADDALSDAQVKAIEALLAERESARKAKNWPEADRIRKTLDEEYGVALKDTPQGATWTVGNRERPERAFLSARRRRVGSRGRSMADYIWGRYPVLEALRSKRRVHRIMVAQGPRDASLTQVVDQARRVGVAVETVSRRHLDDLSKNANHQGVMAVAEARQYADLDDILKRAEELHEEPLVVVLDAIQDVQNLGSLIRTAEIVGAHGVVIPEHRAAGLTPAVDKSSAGAVEFLPVARVTNITRTLDELKRRGLWCIGLDGSAKERYDQANLKGPIALVVGNEGKGIGRLAREHCDVLISIPMRGQRRLAECLGGGFAGAL